MNTERIKRINARIKRIKAIKSMIKKSKGKVERKDLLKEAKDSTFLTSLFQKGIVFRINKSTLGFDSDWDVNTKNVREFTTFLNKKRSDYINRSRSNKPKKKVKKVSKAPEATEAPEANQGNFSNDDVAEMIREFMNHLVGTRSDLNAFKAAMFDHASDLRDIKKALNINNKPQLNLHG